MKFIQLKIVNLVRKNIEIVLLFFLLMISVLITQLYNNNSKKIQDNYVEILKNSYFKKSVKYFFSNLKPKYENVEYKIVSGDSLVSVLNSLSVNKNDIREISEIFNKNNFKDFNLNQIINVYLWCQLHHWLSKCILILKHMVGM